MLKVQILSPGWNRELEVETVFLPGAAGAFQVLPMHAPLVSTLTTGTVRLRLPGGCEEKLDIKWGAVRVEKGRMQLCVQV